MECKFCGADIDGSLLVCPCCGGDLEEELHIQDTTEETFCEDSVLEDEAESEEEHEEGLEEEVTTAKPKRKVWQIAVAIGCCVALLATLALTILNSMGFTFGPKANDILYKDSYLIADEKAGKTGEKVVAKLGDMELTNGELQVFYTLQIYEFSQYYGSVLSYIGMDTTQPLDQQVCYFDDTMTWQQYFIDIAIETWQRYAVLNMLAKEAGLVLPESEQALLDEIPTEMAAMAAEYDFESGDAFIKENYGQNTDIDAYVSYMSNCYLGEYYYSTKMLELMPTDAEIEAYYNAYQADFEASGITKDSGPIVDVRHILVQPEGGETDEDTNVTTYTDDAWADALAEAEALLEQWKNGDADEDSFAALAAVYTDDTGSASNGGLYQEITRDSNYVEPFLEWAVDESRQIGDAGIVKTEFGYHIMYFVTGQPQWVNAAQTQLLSEGINNIIETGLQQWPMSVKYKAIAICENAIVK